MSYSISYISNVKAKIIAKVVYEVEMAERNNNIEALLAKYGVELECEEKIQINMRTATILVIGDLAGSKKDYIGVAKSMGINPDHLEFKGYLDIKSFDARKLEYSAKYSDIIYGPAPHKTTEMGSTSSLLTALEADPSRYPKVIRSESNSINKRLKISISSFRECLSKTNYFGALMGH